jgi:4-hydroxy-tetrahydrodipicolinate synthase
MQPVLVPDGVWPAMITPLTTDGAIDWYGVDALTDWFIAAGVAGLFAVGQSGEMFKLTDDERLTLAQRVVLRTDGRVPVVASGTFGGPIADQAAFIRRMADTGVQAVTVIASEIASPDEDERTWLEHLDQLLELTYDIPLALYECPEPYHRKIAPESLRQAAQTGRFFLMKETSRSIESVRAKIQAAAGTVLKVYNADTTTLLDSLLSGGNGYCGIAANFYPDLLVWLCAHHQAAPDLAVHIQALFGTVDPVLHYKYPVCAKYYHRHTGIDMLTHSRVNGAVLDDYDRRVLDFIAHLTDQHRQLVT